VDDFIKKPCDTDELRARIKIAERLLGVHEHMKKLEGLLPICMYCRRVKSDQSDTEWRQLEDYVEERTDASFSSTVCKNCYETEVKSALDELGQDAAAFGETHQPS